MGESRAGRNAPPSPPPLAPPPPAGGPAGKQRLRARPRRDLWLTEALALVYEITATADRIDAARGLDDAPVVAVDAQSRMLRWLGRASCLPSISDIGRHLRISRQAARGIVVAAADAGRVELLTNRDDRRIIQVELTRRGRSTLAAAQAREKHWAIALLNGLDLPAMRATGHILRVIRQRLVRDERARRN